MASENRCECGALLVDDGDGWVACERGHYERTPESRAEMAAARPSTTRGAMTRFNVALHVFFEDTRAPGHGHTDSARCTVEANNELEAVVLATALAVEDMPEGYRLANAHPNVREVR